MGGHGWKDGVIEEDGDSWEGLGGEGEGYGREGVEHGKGGKGLEG
jgi:hypothetical protein